MKRIEHTLLAFALACAGSGAAGQGGVTYFANPWSQSEAAMSLPSLQGRGFNRFSLTIPSVEAWADNSSIPFGPLRDALFKERYSEELLDAAVQNENEQFYLGFGLQVQLLSLGMNIRNKEGRTLLSLGVEHRERTLFSIDLDQELVSLLYEGNAQYAGRNLVLDPLDIRSMTCRELGMNAAMDIPLGGTEEHRTTLRPGIGIYRVIGIQGTYMNDATLEFFTHADGRAVDLRSNYDLDSALPEEGGQLLRGTGSGFSIDASASVRFDDHLEVFAGVDDIGSIQFNSGTKNYAASGAYTYRGVQYTFIDQELESTVTIDSLVQLGKPTITEEAWRMPLPTQLVIGGTLGSGRTDYAAFPLFRHTWGLCITRDLSRPSFSYAATTVMGSYAFTAAEHITIGATAATNGNRIPRFGINLTLRGGPVRLGVGSTNLTPFIFAKDGSGGNAHFLLQFTW